MMFLLFMAFGGEGDGGTGGDGLWERSGGGPSEIQLNVANGATGIAAFLPGDSRFRMVLRMVLDLLGVPGGGWYFVNATQAMFNGLIDAGGGVVVGLMQYANLLTGEEQKVAVRPGQTSLRSNDGGNRSAATELDPTKTRMHTIDAGTGNNTILDVADSSTVATVNAGGNANVYELDVNGFKLRTSTAPGTEYFEVEADGEISTNQIGATAHATPAGQLKIKDMTGTEFFIDVFQP